MRHRTTTVLLYHRIADVALDPWGLAVSPQHFAEHMQVIAETTGGVRVPALAAALAEGRPLPEGVAITFDDGYVDNVVRGRPQLERFDLPATVYVVSGCVGREREFWWDRLERLLLGGGRLRDPLEVRIRRRRLSWSFGGDTGPPAAARGWRADRDPPPSVRHEAFCALHTALRPLPAAARDDVLAQVEGQRAAGAPMDSSRRCVTPTEIAALGRCDLFDVGAHTVTHPVLTTCSSRAQRAEIVESKRALETWLDGPVSSFSYPYGDTNGKTRRLVPRAGFSSACATTERSVGVDSDPFALPRREVPDCDGDEFRRWLTDVQPG